MDYSGSPTWRQSDPSGTSSCTPGCSGRSAAPGRQAPADHRLLNPTSSHSRAAVRPALAHRGWPTRELLVGVGRLAVESFLEPVIGVWLAIERSDLDVAG